MNSQAGTRSEPETGWHLETTAPSARRRWGSGRPGGRRLALVTSAALVEGAALVYIIGRDGSILWQLARVAGTIIVVCAAVLGLRRGGMLGAGIAYLLGACGISVGLGIGVMHLVKSGDTAVTTAGLLCLGAGAPLLVSASVELMRLVRGWFRPLVVVASVLVAFVLVFPTWQALYVTNVPRTPVGAESPADFGVPYREVRFPASDGVGLSGWYLPSRNGAAVVMMHGAGSTRSAVLRHSVVIAGHGYGVLLYDARGHGRSAGRAMDFGWYGNQDMSGAVSFLSSQPGVDGRRIGAVGLSMGGEEAVGAAATDRRIRAVVAEGVTGRTAADTRWLSQTYGIRGTITEAWRTLLEYDLADLLTDASPPIALRDAVAKASPTPVLLITAADVEEETHAAHFIQSAAPGTVHIWQVPDTGHVQGLITHPRQWENRVTAFLDRALATPRQ
jgi:uncharacterized protein